MQLEDRKKVELKGTYDEEERRLRDKGRIRERCVLFFLSLLNAKFDMLDPDITKMPLQKPVTSALGTELTEEEVATAIKGMANAKAVGPEDLPVESSCARDESTSNGKMRLLLYSTRRMTKPSAETTAASRSCTTRESAR